MSRELCRDYQRGLCNRDRCRYSHSEESRGRSRSRSYSRRRESSRLVFKSGDW